MGKPRLREVTLPADHMAGKRQSQDGNTGFLSSFFPDPALVIYMYILDTFLLTDFIVSQIEICLYFCEFLKFNFRE